MHDGTEEHAHAASGRPEAPAEQFKQVTGAPLPDAYSPLRMLGEGSMAHVFLARKTALRRLVAIKVLRQELAEDPISCKRFIREAQAAARIQHPAVTTVYTVGALANKTPFIEMQYVDGSNLGDLLRSSGIAGVPTAKQLLSQVAAALAAAHECRVIHRDVKPANVLIEPDKGRAFLTDFGVAAILESGNETVTRLTREGERFGDPTYMSPEQLRGETLTPKTDIYSLGLLGYEMLTLQGPFIDAEITDVAAAHIRHPPVDLHARHPEIPADLSDILKRCLSKKPEHRPGARALADALAGSAPANSSAVSEATVGVFASFLKELQKRRVYRAAIAYVAAVYVALQVADLILPALTATSLLYRLIVVASLAGFPVIVALAWVFDLDKGRLSRTDDTSASFTSKGSRMKLVAMRIVGLSLSAVLSAATAWWLLKP